MADSEARTPAPGGGQDIAEAPPVSGGIALVDAGLAVPSSTDEPPQALPALELDEAPLDTDALVEDVYGTVKKTFNHKISPANVVVLITKTMRVAEKVRGATGPEKKDIVLEVIERLVNELPTGEDDKDAIMTAVHLFAPGIIDAVVSAAKGQLDLGKIAKNVRSCFSCFSCCRG